MEGLRLNNKEMRIPFKDDWRNSAAVFVLLLALSPLAASGSLVLNYWTFEGTEDTWKEDKVGNVDLNTVNTPPTQVASTFPDPVPQTGASNAHMASVAGGILRSVQSDHWTDRPSFTIEGFFNLSSVSSASALLIINDTQDGTGTRPFALNIATDQSLEAVVYDPDTGAYPGHLARPKGFAGDIHADKDYYFGASVSTGATEDDRFVTLYLQNLTDAGTLQTVTASLPEDYTHLNNRTDGGGINLSLGAGAGVAYIDEIRFSDGVLNSGELLISIPEPGTLALLCIGLLGLRKLARSKQDGNQQTHIDRCPARMDSYH